MANPIPPLVCSTPPPIDDFEEISQVDDSVDIDFSEYETNTDVEFGSFESPSLPNTPRHIIKDDININRNKSNGFKNIEKDNEPQIIKTENIQTVPIILSDEKLNIETSETSSQNISSNAENVNIDIEIQKISKEQLEQDDKFSNNFEVEKLESPPSLELTVQVVSDENDSFEKISNDGKDCDDNSLELNSESLPKESLYSPTNIKIEKEDIDLDFNDLIKYGINTSSNDSNSDTDFKNNMVESSPFTTSEVSKDIFQVDVVQTENDLNQINDGNLLVDNDLKEHSNTGCEIKNSELLDKSCSQKQNLIFEADFSQFESSITVNDTNETYEANLIHKIEEIQDIEENFTLCNDEFDSFQGFDEVNKDTTFEEELSNIKDNLSEVEASDIQNVDHFEKLNISNVSSEIMDNSNSKENENDDDDDFDDEFGEFSAFKETPITASLEFPTNNKINSLNSEIDLNNETNINDKFKSILEVMFPILKNCDISKGETFEKSVEELRQENSIKINLNQIDSANALDYQWTSSSTRHSLIKSLGIDSRNILYGEKWNCSMPRFASNLGFTPLEPLKPAKTESKVQHTNSVMLNNLNGTNISNKSNTIPEAEFDWNSSGLTNPLDASHAHTLLLDYDLDQLVVVANLDNIKLDSYSSYLYTSSSSVSSTSTSTSTFLSTTTSHCSANAVTTTTTTVPTATIKTNLMKNFDHRWVNFNHDNNVSGTTLGNGSIHNIPNLTNFTSINLNYNKNLLMEFGSNQHYAEIINQINAKKINNVITSMNTTNATNNKTYDIMIDYSLSSRNKKRNEEKQDIEIHTSTNESSEIDPSVRSSKIQDESIKTNVSTEHEKRTTKNSNVLELIDNISSSNNENISTEFTTVTSAKSEFTNDDDDSTKPKVTSIHSELLSIPKSTTTSGTEKLSIVDVSLETNSISSDQKAIIPNNTTANQTATIENKNTFSDTYLKQHSNYSNDYISIGPSTTTYVVPLKETHIFTPTKSENPISQSTNGGDFISQNPMIKSIPSLNTGIGTGIIETIDFDYETAAAGTVINEKVIKKEYHDVEYDPTKFGLKPLDLELIENEVNNCKQQKNKEPQNIDITSLDANDVHLKINQDTPRTSNWTFHLNNFNDDFKPVNNETSKIQDAEKEILNSNNRADPIPFIFNSDQLNKNQFASDSSQNSKTLSNDFDISNDKNKELNDDFKDMHTFETESVPSFERTNTTQNLKTPTKANNSFDDEFTDFQSVLPLPQYKNNPESQIQSSSNYAYQSEKLSEFNSTLTNKSLRDITTSRNQTPTLPPDDRMILSPAILLPQAVSVNQSTISSNKTPKIDWPEPGINNEELARLENIFPQPKTVVLGNAIHSESTTNINSSNNDDDWSDFMSAPLSTSSQNSLQTQQSPKTSNNVSNLNIIYNPQSPTKVSTHRSINHQQQILLNKSNDDDEWSDFISSAPISQNSTKSSGNFYQTQNLHGPITNHNKWNYPNNDNNKQFLPIDQQHFNHNNTLVPSQQQHHGFLNNNNKISKYLLNNASAGNTDNHVNSGSNNMQLNSLKPTDFIPHHHIQHQLLQKQQKILSQSTNNSGGNIGNSISFIPDLGFSSPQNQFINMKKRNYPRK